ncbi:hypothetical protein [Pyrobaculum sp.]|uniref:hypothetical protein n=1 Tax=Pyrobaculum sp. TaxID=2004705 RepID=UPI00315EDEAC
MNLLEGFLAVALFLVSTALILYFGHLTGEMIKLKYVYEATKNGSCGNKTSQIGGIVVAMCVTVSFNSTFNIELYNVTAPIR